MTMKKNYKIKEHFINFVYFAGVFIFALLVTTQALARKVNTFQSMTSPIFFYVDKQDVAIVSRVQGQVEKILVSPGQHVNKGDLIMQIDMTAYNEKISALESVARDNLSAKTELKMLKRERDAFYIYAPQDGIIYSIDTAEGSFVAIGATMATLFADRDARLITYVTPIQYMELQSKQAINVYSSRLKQAFKVKLDGIGKVTDDYQGVGNNLKKVRKYELIFRFDNPDDGAVFIEHESLQFVNVVNSNDIQRPMTRVANLWNALILGK